MAQPTYSPDQKERMARDNGFPSYDAMVLFEQNRRRRTGAAVGNGWGTPPPAPVRAPPQPVQQAPSGFSALLNYIGKALEGKAPPPKRK